MCSAWGFVVDLFGSCSFNEFLGVSAFKLFFSFYNVLLIMRDVDKLKLTKRGALPESFSDVDNLESFVKTTEVEVTKIP